jgi:hypothetical protein
VTSEQKYQYRTDFFLTEHYDHCGNPHTHLRGILNIEGEQGWRVVSTWIGKQKLDFSDPPVFEDGLYVLYERPYTGEFPE